MWPFKQHPKTITVDEYAKVLWAIMAHSSQELNQLIKSVLSGRQIELAQEAKYNLQHEIILAHLWGITKTLAGDTAVLDSLHANFSIFLRDSARMPVPEESIAKWVNERYKVYNPALEFDAIHFHKTGEGGTRLAFEMLKNFITDHDPLDFELQVHIQKHIQFFMMTVTQGRKPISKIC
jgi:hypothetical protein